MHEVHKTRAWFSQRSIRNALLIVCVGVCCLIPQAHGDGQPVKEKVHVTELLKDVGIIGKLGYPVGTLVTVQGTWSIEERKTWEGTAFLDVTSVNGKQMPQAIEFARVNPVDPSEGYPEVRNGEVWEYCCYEEGFFSGDPPTLREEERKVPVGVHKLSDILREPGRAFGIGTRLRYLTYTRK